MKFVSLISNDTILLISSLYRPTVQSTHKQALDEILDLSIDDFEIRAVLKALGATHIIWNSAKTYSVYRYSNYDDLLLASSRKALVCFEESEVMSLLQEWVDTQAYLPVTSRSSILEEKIAPYL